MHLNIESFKIYKRIGHKNGNVMYAILGYIYTTEHIHIKINICLAISNS